MWSRRSQLVTPQRELLPCEQQPEPGPRHEPACGDAEAQDDTRSRRNVLDEVAEPRAAAGQRTGKRRRWQPCERARGHLPPC